MGETIDIEDGEFPPSLLQQPVATILMQKAQQIPAASEEVAAGKPQRDRCYVNSPLSTLRANIGSTTGMMPEDVAAQCRAATPAREDPRMVAGWAGFEKRWSAGYDRRCRLMAMNGPDSS